MNISSPNYHKATQTGLSVECRFAIVFLFPQLYFIVYFALENSCGYNLLIFSDLGMNKYADPQIKFAKMHPDPEI